MGVVGSPAVRSPSRGACSRLCFFPRLRVPTARPQAAPRTTPPLVQLPAVVQTQRIAALKKQLEAMRRNLGTRGGGPAGTVAMGRDSDVLKRIAEKEYHLTHQLDEAVSENVELRRRLAARGGDADSSLGGFE